MVVFLENNNKVKTITVNINFVIIMVYEGSFFPYKYYIYVIYLIKKKSHIIYRDRLC